MKQWMSAIVAAYGILIWIEGMVGYAWTQYYMLLVLGSLAGSLLVVSGFTIVKGNIIGFWGALIVTTLLTIVFAYRLYVAHILMTAGTMTILSLMLIIILIIYKLRT